MKYVIMIKYPIVSQKKFHANNSSENGVVFDSKLKKNKLYFSLLLSIVFYSL